MASSSPDNKPTPTGDAAALAQIASLTEPDLCKYEISICTSLLCSNQTAAAPTPSDPYKNMSLVSLLDSFHGICLQRHEGWWSFEYCHGLKARQFHVSQTQDKATALMRSL